MHAKRPKSRQLTLKRSEEIKAALEREKSRFLARNLDRCGYLRVQFEADHEDEQLVIAVSFTLDAARHWHRVEAVLQTGGTAGSDEAEPRILEVFNRLDDGIGAARIAQLFRPKSEAQWMAAGRD